MVPQSQVDARAAEVRIGTFDLKQNGSASHPQSNLVANNDPHVLSQTSQAHSVVIAFKFIELAFALAANEPVGVLVAHYQERKMKSAEGQFAQQEKAKAQRAKLARIYVSARCVCVARDTLRVLGC